MLSKSYYDKQYNRNESRTPSPRWVAQQDSRIYGFTFFYKPKYLCCCYTTCKKFSTPCLYHQNFADVRWDKETYISVYFHEVQSTNQQNWYPGGHPGESLLYHWLEWWVAWKCWNSTINSVPEMNIHFTLLQVPFKLRQLHSPTVTAKFKTLFPHRKFSNRAC